MKISVTCIYWFLLLVSTVSSCLLFILVAAEGTRAAQTVSASLEDNSKVINSSEGGRTGETSPKREPGAPVTQGADIRSSFEEVVQESGAIKEFLLGQNSGVSNGVSDTGQAVVFTLVDTASAELQQRAELPSHVTNSIPTEDASLNITTLLVSSRVENKTEESGYVVRAEPKTLEGSEIKTNTTELIVEVVEQNNTVEVQEDIPSFSEWTQKQLKEAEEKLKERVNNSVQIQTNKSTTNLKKNYASPDCGAKIVAANPEAISAGSVLSPSRDEYKLNACTSRVWFVVELCEAIQAKKIDLANFELFSSSPKDFTVSVSDRFPSREWSSVGQFQAKDERDIQSFNLHPQLFGKFIKVEMLSHWGSEHFCPISLFRVFGTSEFEVLEDLNGNNEEDDDDDGLDSYSGEPANNLFGSARDAVMSIVKKAAEVLVKSGESNQTEKTLQKTSLVNSCATPSHLVVCDNCSDVLFGQVYELLSCRTDYVYGLVNIPIINQLLYNTDVCVQYGLNFYTKTPYTTTHPFTGYISTYFNPKYIAALCNGLAVIENKVLLNISYTNASSSINNTLTESLIDVEPSIDPTSCPTDEVEAKTCASIEDAKSIINIDTVSDPPLEQIKPTKTLAKDTDPSLVQQPEESSIVSTGKNINLDPSETLTIEQASVLPKNQTEDVDNVKSIDIPDVDTTETFEIAQLDKILSELNLDQEISVPTTVAPPSNIPQQAQKESVFLRLSNRIKALERNMSLSGQYLEELSRRYKKQVEEMQRAFEKKLTVISDECKRREERESRLQEQLEKLTITVESLLSERNSLWKTISTVFQFILIAFLITYVVFYICRKAESTSKITKTKKSKNIIVVKRRKSIDTISHESPIVSRKRRPSEEALKISGTYQDLLIQDDGEGLSKAERRRRRKKNALLRSQSVVTKESLVLPTRRASSSEMTRKPMLNGDLTPPAKIEEIPFVLEDMEHSAMEPVEYFSEIKPETETYTMPKPHLNKVSKNGSLKSSILKGHSPLFMKTALSARSKRNSKKLQLFKTDRAASDASSHRKSPDLSIHNYSDSQDDQSSLNSSDRKKTGSTFKRFFKRVFD